MRRFWYIGALGLAVMASCVSLQTAGVTETGNSVVSGRLMTADSRPAWRAEVLLLPAGYNAWSDSARKILRDTTGLAGDYRFVGVDTGEYNIQAVSLQERTRVLVRGIAVHEDSIDAPLSTLRQPSSLTIELPPNADAQSGYVFVPGTTCRATLDQAAGRAAIDSVPAGTLPAICYGLKDSPSFETLRYDVLVPAGENVTVANPEWKHAARIAINTTASGAGVTADVCGFPLLVRLDSAGFGFSEAAAGGSDLRLTKQDNSRLPFEIERWDAAGQKAELWVKVDTIRGNSDSQWLMMYWGRGASDSAALAVVFDTAEGYAAVWHLCDNPGGGAGSIKDETANAFHATPAGGMSAANAVEGPAGGALLFDGADDKINAGDVDLEGAYTLSCWIRADDLGFPRRILFKEYAYTLWYDIGGPGSVRAEHHDNLTWRGIPQDGGALVGLAVDTWCLLAATYDGDRIRLYVNGEVKSVTNSIASPPLNSSDPLYISKSDEPVDGAMDEVRVERVARGADWMKLCYENQKPGSMVARLVR